MNEPTLQREDQDDESPFVFGTGGDNRKTAALVVVGLIIAGGAVAVAAAIAGGPSSEPKAASTETTALGGGAVNLPGGTRGHPGRGNRGGGFTPVNLPPPGGGNQPQMTTVPFGLVGAQVDDAVTLLRNARLQAAIYYVCTGSSEDTNRVAKAGQEPGARLQQGATVELDVGAPATLTATVPNVVGLSLEGAAEVARERVLRVVPDVGQPTEPAALITSQPAGDLATDAPDDVVAACTKIFVGTTP